MGRIGIVGVGLMGHGIALSLQRHARPIGVLEHPGNQPLADLLEAGAQSFASAKELAAACDTVILCVTGSAQVEAVLQGESGVLAGLRPGSLVIDCSTSVPESTQRMAQLAQQRGGALIDAAMTRTPKEAALGKLNLLVGATAQQFDQANGVLSCFAEKITLVGPVGAGHRMKLLHNYVSLGTVSLLAEAAACAQSAGVPMSAFVDILQSGGGAGIALERLKPYLLDGSTAGLTFSIANAVKDISYYNAMAQAMESDRTLAGALLQTLESAQKAGAENALMPQLVSLIAQRRQGT